MYLQCAGSFSACFVPSCLGQESCCSWCGSEGWSRWGGVWVGGGVEIGANAIFQLFPYHTGVISLLSWRLQSTKHRVRCMNVDVIHPTPGTSWPATCNRGQTSYFCVTVWHLYHSTVICIAVRHLYHSKTCVVCAISTASINGWIFHHLSSSLHWVSNVNITTLLYH